MSAARRYTSIDGCTNTPPCQELLLEEVSVGKAREELLWIREDRFDGVATRSNWQLECTTAQVRLLID